MVLVGQCRNDIGDGGVLKVLQALTQVGGCRRRAAADLKYTNTFGTAAFSLVADIAGGDSAY